MTIPLSEEVRTFLFKKISLNSMKAEMLCLGNELLIGRTVNTNATEISRELTKLGFTFSHHLVVEDSKTTIIDALKWIEKRAPDLLIVTGGLGPTFDDIQMECISEFIGKELELNKEALSMIHKRYGDNMINDARKKMATIPKDSLPMRNSVGTAPGVISKYKGMTIVSLPGVPKEMRAIFYDEMIPYIKENFEIKQLQELGFKAFGIGESKIVELTENVRKNFPKLYFKSHPHKNDGELWLAFHVYGYVDFEEVRDAAKQWRKEVSKVAPRIGEIEKVFTENFTGETN